MILITKSQLDKLDACARAEFFQRAIDFLKLSFSKKDIVIDDNKMLEFVQAGCHAANELGVESERGMVMFLYLQIIAGRNFYEHPDVSLIFADKEKSEDSIYNLFDRIAILEERQEGKLWPLPLR